MEKNKQRLEVQTEDYSRMLCEAIKIQTKATEMGMKKRGQIRDNQDTEFPECMTGMRKINDRAKLNIALVKAENRF